MVEPTSFGHKIKVQSIPLKDDWAYANYSMDMSNGQFEALKGGQGAGKSQQRQGKKMLFLALDKSGSMSGSPFRGLIEGAKVVGKQVLENDSFDHFFTIFYENFEETR